jgi:hypothetical protein
VKADWLPIPFAEAAGSRRLKQILPMELSADEYTALARALRERAVFSAKVTRADILEKLNDLVTRMVEGATPESAAAAAAREAPMVMDLPAARLELKRFLDEIGYEPEPGAAGTIQDLRSDARLNVMLETNEQVTAGWAQNAVSQDPDVLDGWPAWELVRVIEPMMKPRNWQERWKMAGGQFHDPAAPERMIALKNSPVWERLGSPDLFPDALGNPYPPFAFNSGMRVEDVAREECERLGLIEPDAPAPEPAETPDLNENLQQNASRFNAALQEALARDPDLRLEGDTLTLRP